MGSYYVVALNGKTPISSNNGCFEQLEQKVPGLDLAGRVWVICPSWTQSLAREVECADWRCLVPCPFHICYMNKREMLEKEI